VKILFIVPYVPNRIRTRPFNLIKALKEQGHQVLVATLWTTPEELEELQCGLGVEPALAEPISVYRSLWNCLRTLPGKSPLQSSYSWQPKLAAKLGELIQTADVDAVHVEHLRGVRYALYLTRFLSITGRQLPVIWDSVDCISQLFARAGKESSSLASRMIARFELPRTRRYEGWALGRFNRVLVTSQVDRAHLLDLAFLQNGSANQARRKMEARIRVLPNGVDLDYFSPSEDQREPSTLVFTGKMSYHANVAAVTSFVKEVMPELWAARPGVCLWIVGKDPTPEVRELENWRPANGNGNAPGKPICVTGTVDDIRPFLRKAAIAIAPIQYGAGIQNKVLEAMACGTPVVTTPQAVAAITARPGQDLLVAESSRDLAAAIISLLDDPAKRVRLQQSGRCFVERNHNWRAVATLLTSIYGEANAELSVRSRS